MGFLALLYAWQYNARQWFVGRTWRGTGELSVATGEPRRAVIVLTGLIGDTVMSTPVLIEARRLWPKARITVLGNRSTCALLADCPLIDELHEAEAIPFSIRRRREEAALKLWLAAQGFDLAIILLGNQFAAVLAQAAIPVRVGVRGTSLEPCLSATYDQKSPREWGPAEQLGSLRALGYEVEDVAPRLWVTDEARASARAKLAGLGIEFDAPYTILHPFGSTPRQWWPVGRIGELAGSLWRDHGLRVVIVGGPETAGNLPTGGPFVDATGAFTVRDLLAVIDEAALVISTDSGPFHIAGALQRPLVGMFRARRPEHAARYPQARVAFGRDEFCQLYCSWNRCRSRPCKQMVELGVKEVESAVAAVLS